MTLDKDNRKIASHNWLQNNLNPEEGLEFIEKMNSILEKEKEIHVQEITWTTNVSIATLAFVITSLIQVKLRSGLLEDGFFEAIRVSLESLLMAILLGFFGRFLSVTESYMSSIVKLRKISSLFFGTASVHDKVTLKDKMPSGFARTIIEELECNFRMQWKYTWIALLQFSIYLIGVCEFGLYLFDFLLNYEIAEADFMLSYGEPASKFLFVCGVIWVFYSLLANVFYVNSLSKSNAEIGFNRFFRKIN